MAALPVDDSTADAGSRELVRHESNTGTPVTLAPPGYGGRPVIPGLTAITLRPRVSVLSGTVPLAVQVTMLDCDWTGPTDGNPYEDLEYTVNFGDAAGTQRFTNPTNEQTVNPNSDQVGPEALYVYNTPGTYAITVTARGWNGSQFITATTSTVVQGSSALARANGATKGTYTVRVQRGAHVRSARWTQGNMSLVRPAGHAIVPSSAGFMFAGWFKLSTNTPMTLAGTYSDAPALGAGRSWRIWYHSTTGRVSLTVGTPGTTNVTTVSSTETGLSVGWHHVVAWCDTTGTIGISVDGGTSTTAARAAGPMAIPADVPFGLGGYIASNNTLAQSYYGNLDEVAFWNRPPRAGEIAWLYNGGAGRHHADLAASSPPVSLPGGMVAWWTMDEPYGPAWADATGNGHDLQEGLVLASGTPPQVGIMGDVAKVYRPGGVETAPIAYNAGTAQIAAAVAAAIGATSVPLGPSVPGDIYRDGDFAVRFGGAVAGQAWTLAPGTTADGFDGTLQVLGESPGGTATAITANAWPTANYPAIYFNSNAPDGGNGSATAPYNSSAMLRTAITKYGGGKWIRIAAGSDFLMEAAPGVTVSMRPIAPLLFQKWGDGPDPILRSATAEIMLTLNVLYDEACAGVIFDRIAMHAEVTAVATLASRAMTKTNLRRENFYLINCDLLNRHFTGDVLMWGSVEVDNVGMYGGSITGGLPGPSGRPSNVALNAGAFSSVVGTSVSGGGLKPGGGGSVFCHHIYWSAKGCGMLGRWVRFGLTSLDPATGTRGELNFCIKGNAHGFLLDDVHGPPLLRRGFTLDECVFNGTSNPCWFGRHNNSEDPFNAYTQLLLSRNHILYTPPVITQGLGPIFSDVLSLTVRDNLMWRTSGLGVEPAFPQYATQASIYRNKIHGNTQITPHDALVRFRDVSRVICTDNIIMNASPVFGPRGVLFAKSWAAMQALGNAAQIDRNQYYAPLWTDGKIFRDDNPSTTMKTLAQWQAAGFDANSVVADPGWANPSQGDFSTQGQTTITYSMTGSASAIVGDTQTYTLTPSQPVTSVAVTVRLASSTGATTTKVVTLTGGGSVTFQHVSTSSEVLTLTATNNAELVNPEPLVVTILPKRRTKTPRITPMQLNRARAATRRRAGR